VEDKISLSEVDVMKHRYEQMVGMLVRTNTNDLLTYCIVFDKH
jgi:hypothetical protein